MSKIDKYFPNHISSLNKMGAIFSEAAINKTATGVGRVFSIITHYPIRIFRDDEIGFCDILREIRISLVNSKVWLLESNKLFRSSCFNPDISLCNTNSISRDGNNAFEVIFSCFIYMWFYNDCIPTFRVADMYRKIAKKRKKTIYETSFFFCVLEGFKMGSKI